MFVPSIFYIFQIDDSEDADILDSIMDRFPPSGIQVCYQIVLPTYISFIYNVNCYFQTFSTEELIGIASGHIVRTSQMFTHVWRGRIQPHTKDLTKGLPLVVVNLFVYIIMSALCLHIFPVCQRSMASVYYKLRRLKPCLIGNVFLKVDIDEENDLQCSISGNYKLNFVSFDT